MPSNSAALNAHVAGITRPGPSRVIARAATTATTIDTIEAHASMVGQRPTGKQERNSVSRVALAATCCAKITAAGGGRRGAGAAQRISPCHVSLLVEGCDIEADARHDQRATACLVFCRRHQGGSPGSDRNVAMVTLGMPSARASGEGTVMHPS